MLREDSAEMAISLSEKLNAWANGTTDRSAICAIVDALAGAADVVAARIALGALGGDLAAAGAHNADGDAQKALDVLADEVFAQALGKAPVRSVISEEQEDRVILDASAPLDIAIDPLDGSSNIATNAPIGTIFSLMPASDALLPGRRQVAAGFFVYGPRTDLILTVGDGTWAFTRDPRDGTFRLVNDAVRIPEETKEFAINASNARHWTPPIRAYIEGCLEGASGSRGKDFNMRWIASLVADTSRILTRGGIFLYPRDARSGYQQGRLRLLYECNPIAMIVEQAGGAATTGRERVMDLQPAGLHERCPLIFGSAKEVAVVEHYKGAEHVADRSPLFRTRTLFAD